VAMRQGGSWHERFTVHTPAAVMLH
jgi:hypothetical protein